MSENFEERTSFIEERLKKEKLKNLGIDVLPRTNLPLKPLLEHKFKKEHIRTIITSILEQNLKGQLYDVSKAKTWSTKIADSLNEDISRLCMDRYKHVIQVTIAEMKGAGIKSGFRCLWDLDTDGFISENFFNDSLAAVVLVFFIYLY